MPFTLVEQKLAFKNKVLVVIRDNDSMREYRKYFKRGTKPQVMKTLFAQSIKEYRAEQTRRVKLDLSDMDTLIQGA